jgi:hypothetical protein
MKLSIHNYVSILAPALLAASAAAPLAAQERVPGPITNLSDVKTEREPDTLAPPADMVAPVQPPDAREQERRANRAPFVPLSGGRHIDRSFVRWDAPGDGSVWARGENYKARFDAGGASYYPSLGSSAPRTFEVLLSPDRVSVGAQEIPFDRTSPAARTRDRVELDRGAFVEVYDLSTESVEQSFVFHALPRTGDLVVRLPLGGDMAASETDDGIEFHSEFGRVTYSSAIAIDARGQRLAVPTHIEDGHILIRVSAAFVAHAALPLLIDPLVTTFPISTAALGQFTPDGAYDATNECWLVTFVEAYSATDYDVYAELLDTSGAFIAGGYVDYTTTTWDYARCANLSVAQQFLVVAEVTSAGAKVIKGRTIQAANFAMGAQVPISNGEFGDLVHPDVGGDPTFGQAYYCVVYQRVYSATDDDIIVRLIDSAGLSAIGPVYLSNSSSTQDNFPSISEQNGSGSWAIAWERDVNDSSTGIWAGRINWNGAIAAAPFQIINYPYAYLPSVSSPLIASQRNAIVFESVVGGSSANTTDVYCYIIDGGSITWSLDLNTSGFSTGFPERIQVEPRVDSDGQHFAVVYSELQPSTASDYNVYIIDVGMTGTNAFVSGPRTSVATGAGTDHIARIVSAHGSGGPAYRYLALWQTEQATSDVFGALYDGNEGGKAFGFCLGDGGSFSQPCPCGNNGTLGHGCANSANPGGTSMYASGSLSTVHDTTVLNAIGLPATTACLFFQAATALQTPTPFGDGLFCINGSILRLGVAFASGGIATHPGPGDAPLSVHGAIPIDGITAYYQCWYRDAVVFCTSSTFNLTNAVLINWGR